MANMNERLKMSWQKLREFLLAEMLEKARTWGERIERNPWTHEYRAAALRAEAAGHDGPIKDFIRRFKMAEALRYSR